MDKIIAIFILVFFIVSSFLWIFFSITWWEATTTPSGREFLVILFHIFAIILSTFYLLMLKLK